MSAAPTTQAVQGLPELVKQIQAALDAGPTDGNWELCYLDTPLSQVGAYVQKCVEVSGGDKYQFIRAVRPDGVPVDVAHYGNGPTSNINGHWATVTRPENIRVLLSAISAHEAEVGRLRAELKKSPDWKDLLTQLVEALDNTFISSWQSTAGWQKQLDQAMEALKEKS